MSSRELWRPLLLALTIVLAATNTAVRERKSGPIVAWGMFQDSAPYDMTELTWYENQLGRHSAIIHWYQAWGDSSAPFSSSLFQTVRSHGSTPFVTWEPWDGQNTSNNPFPLTSIANGSFDNYITSWGQGLASYGHPVLLAFAHEMQDKSYPWGYTVNGNTPAQYVAAYRHVHDVVVQAGATNVQWVWLPDQTDGQAPIGQFYPGDAYADWVGVDAYNWGTTQSWSSWQSFTQVFTQSYQDLQAVTSSKPILLGEWASAEQGGDKASWVLNAGTTIPTTFSRLRAVVWFNKSNTQWALDSSSTAFSAAQQAFSLAGYDGRLLHSY